MMGLRTTGLINRPIGALHGWCWALQGKRVEGEQDGNGEEEAPTGKTSVRCVLCCPKL